MVGNKKKSTDGFTLVELLVVLAILAIMVAIAVPNIVGHIDTANKSVDNANLKLLNDATFYYSTFKDVPMEEVFADVHTDSGRMQKLVDAAYLDFMLEPRQEDVSFAWNINENVWELKTADSVLTGFAALLADSGIDLTTFLGKNTHFSCGGSKYKPNSWSGYIEKLLEAGDVASNNRISANEGSNTIGYQNPFSDQETIINYGDWDFIKKKYPDYVPPAVFITNNSDFNYNASNHDYINNNIDSLKGAMIFYKDDSSANSDVQVYYINEDGSFSDLYAIGDVIDN